VDGVRQVLREPVAALHPGVRVGADAVHVGQLPARRRGQRELDGDEDLAQHHQGFAGCERVERCGDAALDGALDRDDGEVGSTRPDGADRRADVRLRQQHGLVGPHHLQQRLLGERAGRSEVGVPGAVAHRSSWRPSGWRRGAPVG